ncbi:DUF4179 domain-containing protein [Brevibacillus daliensis]|uniref:DUF4179 domain-containing protein n=1 Tax=Brevibacillus daliensis TaxID=2892995 RepID=UPI001E3396E4|nr:DUF4179 domain-containing protein [Brevibacillus daliensis]
MNNKVKQEMERIKIPADIHERAKLGVKKVKSEQRRRFKKPLVAFSAAAIAVGVLVGSASVSPTMANFASTIINSIFSESGNKGLEQVSKLGLTDMVGETKVAGGTALTVTELFYEGSKITIGYSFETKKQLSDDHHLGVEIKINNESVSYSGGQKEQQIDPNHRTGLIDFELRGNDVKDKFDLGLAFTGENGEKWEFTLPVQAHTNIKTVAIDTKQTVNGNNVTISDLKISPAGLVIAFQSDSAIDSNHLMSYLDFKVVDEKGNEIGSHSGGTMGEIKDGRYYYSGNRYFDPIGDDVKELTITPYLVLPTGGGGVEIDQDGKEKVIEFKPIKDDITFKTFKVKLP